MEFILVMSVLLNIAMLWLGYWAMKKYDDLLDDCFAFIDEIIDLKIKIKELES
ncbi:hypothetical protein [Selenomonas ruminantium]|uniref:Uncharacterized protein n=1 Tax=Selenomonas ruminantium TaxID=971 RepID=A0A1I0YCV3_SELRU|nr:hypothetical protein [Selenomonas ruminantium]SFB10023.1 hypothetical protein SAMN05216587_11122 [Selenomonas ruminantium]